jgi:hypothetical protein
MSVLLCSASRYVTKKDKKQILDMLRAWALLKYTTLI